MSRYWNEGLNNTEDDTLEHFGVLGMKWGIRRYQNKDGSLTPAGKRKYKISSEGKLVKRSLTESLKKNLLSTIGAIPALPGIKRFSKTMDYKEYGGALFLGVKKPVVKAHGSSDDYLFYFTIKQAEKFAESKAVEILKEEFEKMK